MAHPSSLAHRTDLFKATDEAITAAFSVAVTIDRLLGSELSEVLARVQSVVTRHGGLIEKAVEGALKDSGRYEVLTQPAIGITAAADALVSAKGQRLPHVALRYDSAISRYVHMDAVVIDPDANWAGAYDVKRGGGDMRGKRKRQLEHDLSAVGLMLRAWVRDNGYPQVDRISVAVLDVFEGTGLPSHLALRGVEIDDHFGVPVMSSVEAMTDRLRARLQDEIPGLLRPLLPWPARAAPTLASTRASVNPDAGRVACTTSVDERPVRELGRPAGPGPRPEVVSPVVSRPPLRT